MTSDQHRVVRRSFFRQSGFRTGFSLFAITIVSAMLLVACGGSGGKQKQIKDIQLDIQADWEYTYPSYISGRGTFTLKGAIVHGEFTGTLHFADETGNVIYDGSVGGGLYIRTMTVLGWCQLDFTTAGDEIFVGSSAINQGSTHVEDFCPCCEIEADVITNGNIITSNSGSSVYGTWKVKATP